MIRKLFAGWTFRTATPEFAPDEVITAFVTGRNDEGVVVRIGDSRLHVPNGDPTLVDRQVRLRVESFDSQRHEGTAELLSVVDEP